MSSDNPIRDTFFEECEDLLAALTEGLDQMDEPDCDSETVNAVFRAVHSIKGGAGAFALDELVAFAHKFETVLDRVRSNEIEVDPELMRTLHRAGDLLSILVEYARDDEEFDDSMIEPVVTELATFLDSEAEEEPQEELVFQPMTLNMTLNQDDSSEKCYQISFKPHKKLYENGHDPVLLFRALAEIGTLQVVADYSSIPSLAEMTSDKTYVSWDLELLTNDPETSIDEIFEFVDGLCDLKISTENPELPDLASLGPLELPPIAFLPELTPEPLSETPKIAPETAKPTEKAAQPAASKAPRGPKPTLRVDPDRVDRLINTVGELIINQSMIAQRLDEFDLTAGTGIIKDLEDYKMLARDIQESVMAIRAQPVKPLFQRMSRIVREAGDATGKIVKLVPDGETTEIDKTVIERLADPLTHMIRNAVDHGLETTERRLEIGKPETGIISLSAMHRSGNVVIEIADDGAGLNRTKIFEIAVSKGLVSADAELSESEIDNLLFLPGFSTATAVSNLSGRGVGMDVVKNAVTALGGRVSISSTKDVGTVFTVILPLTLAVMDGMLISVGEQTMVVPISSVIETILPDSSDLHSIGASDKLLSVRGRYIPIVDVSKNLGFKSDQESSVFLVVETETQGQCALAVDAIHDQRQVVIKSLEGNYGEIEGVSAATILGNGRIALILEPEAVANTNLSNMHLNSITSTEHCNANGT
jgi:two-component system chemotaxis sensor kinase CheA